MNIPFTSETCLYLQLTAETFPVDRGNYVRHNVLKQKYIPESSQKPKIQEQIVSNMNTQRQSEPPVRQRGRPTNISTVWIIICGLFHNMGGIGCCLLWNVYVAPQSSREIVIRCETELINWPGLVKEAGIIRTIQALSNTSAGHGMANLLVLWMMKCLTCILSDTFWAQHTVILWKCGIISDVCDFT